MEWYFANGGEQVGPLDDLEFHARIRKGDITPETPVWREGMAEWIPYAQVSGRKAPAEEKKKLVLQRDAGHGPTGEGSAGADHGTDAEAGNDNAAGPFARTGGGGDLDPALSAVLYQGKGWIRFTGILTILTGVLQALTIVGLIYAWIFIWLGILLCGAASQITIAHEQSETLAMATALDKFRLYFKILGILAVIGLVVGAVVLVIALVSMGGMMFAF